MLIVFLILNTVTFVIINIFILFLGSIPNAIFIACFIVKRPHDELSIVAWHLHIWIIIV
jgi:hypothetical protein